MRTLIISLLFLAGCTPVDAPEIGEVRPFFVPVRVEPVWDAVQYMGLHERKDRAELRELIGGSRSSGVVCGVCKCRVGTESCKR